LKRFFANEFKLRGLEVLSELNGTQYSTLNPKLFERIGITDIFVEIKVTEKVETVSTDELQVRLVDFRGVFNSVCSMRNNILHQDESPNLNTGEIEQYRQQFESFAIGLDAFLSKLLPQAV
jgi:hypothetical protein